MNRKLVVLIGIIVTIFCTFTVSVNAISRDSAVQWAKTQANNGIMYEDSGYGGQCTDFVSAYMNYIVYGDAHYWKNSGGKGFRTYDAKEYFNQSYPNGWQKISNTPDFVPQPGDILCFDASSSNVYGHVAVAIEGCTVSSIKGIGQDGLANNGHGTPAQYQTMSYYGGWGNFQGVIRPKWDTTTPTEQPVDLGTDFYAVILNKACWKPITCDDDNYIRLRTETGSANQVWLFRRQSDGSYTIASAQNKKLLEMTLGDTTDGNQVSVGGEDWGGNYQRWFIYEYGGGYIIKSHHYVGLNRVLDLQNNNSADGAHITTFTRNNSAAQIWAIYKGDEVQLNAPALSVKQTNSSVSFTWNEVYGEKRYDVKIWNGKYLEGEAYHIKWGASSPYTLNLPAGHYEAYVDATNEFLVKRSNVVTFDIKQPSVTPSLDTSRSVYKINTSVADLLQNAVCTAVLYTSDGVPLETDSINLQSGSASAFFAFAKDCRAEYIKIFLWDSLNGMKPLCESIEIQL